jgi:uncharacterized protein (UPF0335 family)
MNEQLGVGPAPSRAPAHEGHNSSVAGAQLRQIVERIERLESEIAALNDDKREVYTEAKSAGFDTKIIKQIIGIRRKDPTVRMEEEAIRVLYMNELGML